MPVRAGECWVLVRTRLSFETWTFILALIHLRQTPSLLHHSDPRECNIANDIAQTCEQYKAPVLPVACFKQCSRNGQTCERAERYYGVAGGVISPVLFGHAELADTDRSETDVGSGAEAKQDRKGYSKAKDRRIATTTRCRKNCCR